MTDRREHAQCLAQRSLGFVWATRGKRDLPEHRQRPPDLRGAADLLEVALRLLRGRRRVGEAALLDLELRLPDERVPARFEAACLIGERERLVEEDQRGERIPLGLQVREVADAAALQLLAADADGQLARRLRVLLDGAEIAGPPPDRRQRVVRVVLRAVLTRVEDADRLVRELARQVLVRVVVEGHPREHEQRLALERPDAAVVCVFTYARELDARGLEIREPVGSESGEVAPTERGLELDRAQEEPPRGRKC